MLSFNPIVVEGDCNGAIDLINSVENCLNEFEPVLSDIASLAKNIVVVSSSVPKNCNRVAYCLARHAFINLNSESWNFLFLDWLLDLVSHY